MSIFGISVEEIIICVAKEISKHRRLRKNLLIVFLVSGLVFLMLIFISNFLISPFADLLFQISTILGVVDFIGLLTVMASYSSSIVNKLSVNEKLTEIKNERIQIEKNIEEKKGANVQEIIRLNLNQLDEYYTINKKQNKNSYSISVFTIIVGFFLIVATIVMYFVYPDKYAISIITGLTGLVSEFIGATSLLLYKESNKHLNEFIDRLTFLQRVMLAIDLVEGISENNREKEISKIVNKLVNYENKESEKT